MCIVAKGSKQILHKIKVNKKQLDQIAEILEIDKDILSDEKLIGIEFLYKEGDVKSPAAPSAGARGARKARGARNKAP